MADLVPPGPDTRMVRRLAGGEYTSHGKWHFLLKPTSERKCLCGKLLASEYQVEYTTLAEVKRVKDICPSCWPFS